MREDVYRSIGFKLIDTIVHYDTSLTDLNLDSRSQECKQVETSTAIISQCFESIWMEFGPLLRLVSVSSRERTIFM